ncbi:MAG: D-glycero-beta-D-manno-heptose-7-phosphate kinase [Candidatus Omnitrophica bacterium]|nr:D-glycero-beta-D-manno-heptose-7-phosphate kinase [Candidatus Omnitrophota bacterium]MCM8828343.1 D-glycero-beta-D-manno-heptose-7-phosphate kinase [Candidatus Omnitrophota bacterium]
MAGMLKQKQLEKILAKIPEIRVLVVGDLILDHFVSGQVKRISPEAPVPVVEVKKEIYRCGGAGNVCFNIKGLGGNVTIVSVIGEDENGTIVKNMLEESHIGSFLVSRKDFPTSIKTRIIAGSQQMIRVDKERIEKLSQDEISRIQDFFAKEIENIDAVIISDYGKGMIIPSLISYFVQVCRRQNKIITVDPKINHFFYYKNVDCLTPNLMEASMGMHLPEPSTEEEIVSLGKKIRKKLSAQNLVITRGKDGMTIFSDSGVRNLPAVSKEVFDVTGAGDTVIAVITLAMACGFDVFSASFFANLAAGIVVQKLGTANVSPEELKAVFNDYVFKKAI